jgi:hypothetical protein
MDVDASTVGRPTEDEIVTNTTKRVQEWLETTWVVIALAALAFVADMSAVYVLVKPIGFGIRTTLVSVGAVCTFLLLAGVAYSVRVRQTNLRLRGIPGVAHRINHEYRDVLSQVFGTEILPPEHKRVQSELRTIESTCQRVAQIFSVLTQQPCTVTVKLIRNENGVSVCETYARNETSCHRDQMRPRTFQIGTGVNTAFDEALKIQPNGQTAHFFSPDLKKEPNYNNERGIAWERLYKSGIVVLVPIRYVNPLLIGQPGASDHIGFLSVDTLSTHVLNGSYHVELLASFADQMYNFMCLMRGKYAVPRRNGAVVA